MAQNLNQEEIIRWMDDILVNRPEIRQNAEKVIAGMWTFGERMRKQLDASGHQLSPQ